MTGNLTALEQHELWRVVAKNATTDVENLRKKRFTHVTDGKARDYAKLAFPLLLALEKTEPAVVKTIADAVAGLRRDEHPNFPNPDTMDEGRVVACLLAVEQLMHKQFAGDVFATKFLRGVGVETRGNTGVLAFSLPTRLESTCTACLFVLRCLYVAYMKTKEEGVKWDIIGTLQHSSAMMELAYRKSWFRLKAQVYMRSEKFFLVKGFCITSSLVWCV